MSAAKFQHGTLSGYKHHRCRCDDCRAANTEYSREHKRRANRGARTTNLVNAEPVRVHLRALHAKGMRVGEIAEASSTSASWVRDVIRGRPSEGLRPLHRVSELKARRALAIPVPQEMSDSGVFVCGDGPRRRAQALMAIGHSGRWQADQIGASRSTYRALILGPGRVTAGRAAAVRRLYGEYWNRPAEDSASSRRVRAQAEGRGYRVPMAWDDELIDLPEVELWEVLAARARRMSRAQLVRCARAWSEGERSPQVVAAVLEFNRVRAAEDKARRREREAA